MFDIHSQMKQEDTSRKTNLLKQIKISIESLMFESSSAANRWQNVGVLSILARHILAILEDGFILNESTNTTSSSSSPNLSLVHSRTTTLSSLSALDLNSDLSQALWSFILVVFTSDSQKPNVKNSHLEQIVRKDFESIHNQIKSKEHDPTIEPPPPNEESINVNMPLSWIKTSLRQTVLLNQLVYLSSDSTLIEKYYQTSAFLLDRMFVNDFLNYIKACESRDYTVLRKIKCKFFTPAHESTRSPGGSTTTSSDKNSHRSASSSHASSLTSQTHPFTNGCYISINGSNNNSNNTSGVIETASSPTSSIHTNSENNNNNSLIEIAVNEVILSNKLKQQQTHRRMHSFPNIQINEAKRKLLSATYTNGVSMNQSMYLNGDLIDSNNNNDSFLLSSPRLEESNLENQLSTSTLMVNNQLEENLTSSASDNNNNNKNETSSDLNNNNNNNKSSEIYEKTSVFDFIHSQQINCDCNQVEKESSHFIIADIAIAAFELVRTQELDDIEQLVDSDLLDESRKPNEETLNVNFLTVNRTSNVTKRPSARLKSTGIKIVRNQSSQFVNSFTSQMSPINGTFFSSEEYASSVEREIFYGSECTSPNVDSLSSASGIVVPQAKRGHKKSLSLVNQSVTNDLNKSKTLPSSKSIFKSFSSNNITTNEVIHELTPTVEKEITWLSKADTINQRNDKITFRITDDSQTPNEISLSSSPVNPQLIESKSTNFLTKQLNRNLSTNTINSQTSQRTRRFSWEEILNLDTAEHIANRLIQKLIESENQRKQKTDTSKLKPTQVPNVKQFEIFIQMLEFFEYMQIYYELRSSGILHKYIQALASTAQPASSLRMSASSIYLSHFDSPKQVKPSQAKLNSLLSSVSKTFHKSFKSSIISKIKLAAMMSALQQKTKLSEHIETNTSHLIKQISLKMQDSVSLDDQTRSLKSEPTNDDLDRSTTSVSSLAIRQPRLLGDESWAPVRDQLILNVTPKLKRLDQMRQQNFHCADCGIQVREDKMKSFNYCEYFCKYFCRCCHINNQSYIPAYIVNSLDFRTKYEVSKKAKNFLEKIYNEPVITLESLNPGLYERTNIFSKFKKIRFKLYNCRHYINACRFALDLKKKLYNHFDDFIINDPMVYSIETLFKIKQTNYYETLKQLVQLCIDHIRSCELCSQQGYICGLCSNNELLYPFDLEKVQKCDNCLAVCHKTCLKKPELCPRCKRKKNRLRVNSAATTNTTISVSNE